MKFLGKVCILVNMYIAIRDDCSFIMDQIADGDNNRQLRRIPQSRIRKTVNQLAKINAYKMDSVSVP